MQQSIRTRLVLSVVALVVIIQSTSSYVSYFQFRGVLIENAENRGESIATHLFYTLTNRIDTAMNEEEDLGLYLEIFTRYLAIVEFPKEVDAYKQIDYIAFIDNNATIKAHQDIDKIGTKTDKNMFNNNEYAGVQSWLSNGTMSVTVPYLYRGQPVGYLLIASSSSNLVEERNAIIVSTLTLLFFYIIAGAIGAMIISINIVSPLETLTSDAKRIANGRLDHEISVDRRDEIGSLAKSLSKMQKSIHQKVLDLRDLNENLEKKVRERTAQLEEEQERSMENAHKAGMVEVATSTLHNIGNILNTVQTSVVLIGEVIDHSRLKGLLNANALLQENIDKPVEFLTRDEKGIQLLHYYLKLGEQLSKENEEIKNHVARLTEKVQLITETIAAQQDYASMDHRIQEGMQLSELVDDALKLKQVTLDKNSIKLEKQYKAASKAIVDRTKVLNIILNLIENAKDAMRLTPLDTRILRFGIEEDNADIRLMVTDYGEGIEQKNMEKIFNYGFTTKKNGHGFGLHSCANYMTEMGGRMWAQSEGKGASFTLLFKKYSEQQTLNMAKLSKP